MKTSMNELILHDVIGIKTELRKLKGDDGHVFYVKTIRISMNDTNFDIELFGKKTDLIIKEI